MGCLGVLFALTEEQESLVLNAAMQGDERLEEVIDEIESGWDAENLVQVDKSWDAIHRCLTDGNCEFENGTYPLNRAILGGSQLYRGDEYIVSFIPKSEVPDVAEALAPITEPWFCERFFRLIETDFPKGHVDEEFFEYVWDNFQDLRDFYQDAASSGRIVIFTVDQ